MVSRVLSEKYKFTCFNNTMSTIGANKISQAYKNEYSLWRNDKNLRAAKREEYLRRNPDTIKDYDLQRAKTLLSAVDIMDKAMLDKSDNVSIAFESAATLGLGYAAIGGAGLGFLFTKLGFVKKGINNIVKKFPKSKNIISTSITAISGVLGVLAAYPAYTFLSKIETKVYRKRRFEAMEKELQDPKIFAVLDEGQKKLFEKNLENLSKEENKNTNKNFAKNELKNIHQITKETLNYDREQARFKEKYKENRSLYENVLTEKEIKNAKKDKALLLVLLREMNTKAQSYTERMQRITDNIVTLSFALASLFTLGHERVAKKLNFKTSSLPANMGILLLISSTFFATWAQKRAALVGKFKAKQDLMQNPEQLVYISNRRINTIDDEEIELAETKKPSTIEFLKEFYKNNKEYNQWKKEDSISGEEISKAKANIDFSEEQIQDAKRLQKNMFKTFYRVDKNTQSYSGSIDVLRESVKYPINLVLGTIASGWGMKHLIRLRSAKTPQKIFKHSTRYLGAISAFAIPSILVNSYFARAQKMGARLSDMATMKDLEDYRFFADYSRFNKQ